VVSFARVGASSRIPRRAGFVQVLENVEMAASGCKCAREPTTWALLLHAILHDVKMAARSCVFDRPTVPIKLSFHSQPTKQLEVSRTSCFTAEMILRSLFMIYLLVFYTTKLHWWIAVTWPACDHEHVIIYLPLCSSNRASTLRVHPSKHSKRQLVQPR